MLEIPSITGSDDGPYQCTVTNAAGSGSSTTLITGTYVTSYMSVPIIASYSS